VPEDFLKPLVNINENITEAGNESMEARLGAPDQITEMVAMDASVREVDLMGGSDASLAAGKHKHVHKSACDEGTRPKRAQRGALHEGDDKGRSTDRPLPHHSAADRKHVSRS
jgi:hypothetical protein